MILYDESLTVFTLQMIDYTPNFELKGGRCTQPVLLEADVVCFTVIEEEGEAM